ncbi:phosphoenolpyruvate carboxykinase (ATP) [Nonomuraea turcica]|uniref:hypothetical protein n=1 Tax=Nonomuraea sp. G32 TaxID=3067274 RepID=UPI00273C5D17|nr:hypothetical protein [Nonomuraea sp. G32]MDP4500513.1 hypothetical protein [Nonomuraea sp. G32]
MVSPIYRLGAPHDAPGVTVRVALRAMPSVDPGTLADCWRLPRLSMGPSSTTYVCVGHQAGAVRWLRQRENDAAAMLISAEPERGLVELEVYDESTETMRAISRMLMYVIGGQLEAAGLPAFHASGVARDGAGVLIMGKAGSGKSTLAFQVCTLVGWDFLAEDMVHIWRRDAGGPPLIAGWPKRVAVSATALVEHPQRSVIERASLRWHKGPVGPLGGADVLPWGAEHRSRVYFDLEEFFPLTRVHGVPEAELVGVVLPVAERERAGWRIDPVTRPSWHTDPHCLADTRQRKHGIDFLGVLPRRPTDSAERSRTMALVQKVPCVRVAYGPDVNRHMTAFWGEVADRLSGA